MASLQIFLPSRCKRKNKFDIVGNFKINSLCNIKKFSKSEGVTNVTKTSHMEKLCCKKCGIVLCVIRTVCCEMTGSKWKLNISKITAVVKMYQGIVVKYCNQTVCLNAILQTKRSVQMRSNEVDNGEERTGRKNNMWNVQ